MFSNLASHQIKPLPNSLAIHSSQPEMELVDDGRCPRNQTNNLSQIENPHNQTHKLKTQLSLSLKSEITQNQKSTSLKIENPQSDPQTTTNEDNGQRRLDQRERGREDGNRSYLRRSQQQ